jgi:hypothetical protein
MPVKAPVINTTGLLILYSSLFAALPAEYGTGPAAAALEIREQSRMPSLKVT